MAGMQPVLQLRRSRDGLVRLAWRVLAVLALGLAILGAILPVMPTVPFLLLAAWAAGRGSPRFERWLLEHRVFGPPIVRWREHRSVSRRAKWTASGLMLLSAVSVQFFNQIPAPLRMLVPIGLAAAALWLWLRPET